MCWLKRDLWKAGIACTGMLLLLMAIAGLPVSAADTHEELAGLAGPGTVTAQVTPTEDATVTALNKEKLAQEVQQLKNQNEQDPFGWLRTNATILISTLVVVIGGLIGLFRWFADRRSEREKRAEERFQSVVTGLGDEKEGARIGAAILLRTFLRPGYEQFYIQTFDLAVANLRLPRTPNAPKNSDTPLPLSTLNQALIVVFKEAFPLARSQHKGSPRSLDASRVQLDNAYLREADLKQVWLRQASLREANLNRVDLSVADLLEADLSQAYLSMVNLSEARLRLANLSGANLQQAHLGKANCRRANFSEADLSGADLSQANFEEADLSKALLNGANLRHSNLRGADLSAACLNASRTIMTAFGREMNLEAADLSETNIEDALSLKDTNLRGVTGLTKEQKDACKAKGAFIDEAPTTSPSRSPVSPPPPSQTNELQAPSVPPTQTITPISHTDGSSVTSSKPSLEP